MATPLYKFLKEKSTSFYAFPGSANDISAAYQNQNYTMYFSNFALLNFPKQNLTTGTNSNPIVFDFNNAFVQESSYGQQATTYSDQIIESLRNYVANEEETIRGSMLNNTDYFYDNTILHTTSERIFWKWCKSLNLIDFEPAINGDQYFGNLVEFERNNLNDDSYFPEILWVERNTSLYSTDYFYQTAVPGFSNKLEVEIDETQTNLKVGDIIKFDNITNSNIAYLNGIQSNILYVIPSGATQGQRFVLGLTYSSSLQNETTGTINLVYNKLIQYISEVNGINNVQSANRSYTEVYAHIPDSTGQTPDILFRTMYDSNYGPGLFYPIIPSQYQPEIIGAELFNSPIVNNPQNYPGNYYGQFDNIDYTYETADGDTLRRSGNYFGINGTINSPIINGQTIDGISVDFNTSHYVKMNIINQEIPTFEQFNSLQVNNQPPKDFEFNAVLWYYTVQDNNGNISTNLYGISFLDNPINNTNQDLVGLCFPVYKKLAANDKQDGTSYAFSLNLNFNIINENPQDSYNPNAINSLFGFNLFNEAMRRLASTNDSFLNIISKQTSLQNQISNLSQLVFTTTDISTINSRISYLESLLSLYQYNQIVSSDTINVTTNSSISPSYLTLNTIDTIYQSVNTIYTTDLYNSSGIIPLDIPVIKNKSFLLNVVNNDQTNLTLPKNDKLTILLSRDLDYKQSFDLVVNSTPTATQNKQLQLYINYSNGNVNQNPVPTLVSTIDLPIYYNSYLQNSNSAKTWDRFDFKIDITNNINLHLNSIIDIPLTGTSQTILNNSIKKGDTLVIGDLFVGTSSVVDLSGQYTVYNVSTSSLYISLDASSNVIVNSYASSNVTNGVSVTINNSMVNYPYLKLNKGIKYSVTMINNGATSSFSDRYLIQKEFL